MKAILTKALFLLIVLNMGAVSVFAQGHTIQKPVRQQRTTTTTTTTTTTKPTTTTTPQKPRTNTSTSSQSSSSTKVSEPTGYINGHGYVDLGLSVKWATCNVGASSPSDYGNYYAWGETTTKSEYTRVNSKTYGKSMGNIAGDPQYDAVRANWESTWRLPTASEIDELINKCTWTWTTQGRHYGYKVTGANGKSIFLPAAGWYSAGYGKTNEGDIGRYWSASPDEDNKDDASGLHFSSGTYGSISRGTFGKYRYHRCNGESVRPVSD